MSLLCTLERAKLNVPSATTADDRTLAALVAACSAAIEKYLRRRIAVAEFDEVHDGTERDHLMLRQYPVQRIDSVRHSPRAVLEVTNTTATNQIARAEAQRDGLRLVRVASGTTTADTSVTWASNATLSAVATAVAALGNGWNARAASDYASWPARELWLPLAEGDGGPAFDCRGRWAGLSLHVGELAGYAFDARGWLYRRDPWADGVGWDGGPGHWRVRYTAGYAEVPAALEEACAEWAAELFQLTRRDPAAAAQTINGLSSTAYQSSGMPPRVAALLAAWRAFGV